MSVVVQEAKGLCTSSITETVSLDVRMDSECPGACVRWVIYSHGAPPSPQLLCREESRGTHLLCSKMQVNDLYSRRHPGASSAAQD